MIEAVRTQGSLAIILAAQCISQAINFPHGMSRSMFPEKTLIENASSESHQQCSFPSPSLTRLTCGSTAPSPMGQSEDRRDAVRREKVAVKTHNAATPKSTGTVIGAL